jgi:hypothetical protein
VVVGLHSTEFWSVTVGKVVVLIVGNHELGQNSGYYRVGSHSGVTDHCSSQSREQGNQLHGSGRSQNENVQLETTNCVSSRMGHTRLRVGDPQLLEDRRCLKLLKLIDDIVDKDDDPEMNSLPNRSGKLEFSGNAFDLIRS